MDGGVGGALDTVDPARRRPSFDSDDGIMGYDDGSLVEALKTEKRTNVKLHFNTTPLDYKDTKTLSKIMGDYGDNSSLDNTTSSSTAADANIPVSPPKKMNLRAALDAVASLKHGTNAFDSGSRNSTGPSGRMIKQGGSFGSSERNTPGARSAFDMMLDAQEEVCADMSSRTSLDGYSFNTAILFNDQRFIRMILPYSITYLITMNTQ